MSHSRQFGIWILATVVAVAGFLLVVRAQYRPTQARFAPAVNAHPAAGRDVFESKGCARCHGADAAGTAAGPSLRNRASLTSSARIVTALWNHVPRMSEAIQAAGMPYPAMSHQETAQLVSFLFVTGLTDDAGDAQRGAAVFSANGCAACHRSGGEGAMPGELGTAQSPLAFTESLWNHASAMQAQMQRRAVHWPRFGAADLRDLLAYLQSESGKQASAPVRAADPARGWQLFQSQSCIQCHALRGRESSLPMNAGSAAAPPLPASIAVPGSPDSDLPPTLSEFGAALLNHYPKMQRAIDGTGGTPPKFSSGDVTDLAVFLYGLRNTEPTGSAYVGASIFTWRGCAACHGEDAAGGSAPALRGRGQTFTAVRLATGLWAHGDRMYRETLRSGRPWPRLEDSDIGDLLAFLNTPL